MFTTTVPMATKLGSLVTYLEELLSYSNMAFNEVALLDHVAIRKTLLLTFTRLMATKLDSVLTSRFSIHFGLFFLRSSVF